jgi:hypothetical protein
MKEKIFMRMFCEKDVEENIWTYKEGSKSNQDKTAQ